MRARYVSWILWSFAAVVAAGLLAIAINGRAEFLAGGALVNIGFRLQDHLEPYDPAGELKHGPEHILQRMLEQNDYASRVREWFPRTSRHPLVAMVVCMDARIDTSELVGDTRKYYYVIRTAGSVLSPIEQDMLQLAVENGVKLILLTTHSECAAEKAAADPALRAKYPYLVEAVDDRSRHDFQFLQRPAIARRIARGELVVQQVHIDTKTAKMHRVQEATAKLSPPAPSAPSKPAAH